MPPKILGTLQTAIGAGATAAANAAKRRFSVQGAQRRSSVLAQQAPGLQAMQARTYVSRPGLQQLMGVNVARLMAAVFTFRQHRLTDRDEASMQTAAEGLLRSQRSAAPTWMQLFDPSRSCIIGHVTVADLQNVLAWGPVGIQARGVEAPGHGTPQGPTREMVLAAAFTHTDGRVLGLVVDGDPRQQNPAMAALGDWLARPENAGRTLESLGTADFDRINADLQQSGASVDVMQAAFRIVDLHQFAGAMNAANARAAQRGTETVILTPQVKMKGPVLSEGEVRSLQQAVADGHLDVEQFPASADAPPGGRFRSGNVRDHRNFLDQFRELIAEGDG